MRKTLTVKGFDGKTVEIVIVTGGDDHLESQKKYKAKVFRDRTKYRRKEKYSKREED